MPPRPVKFKGCGQISSTVEPSRAKTGPNQTTNTWCCKTFMILGRTRSMILGRSRSGPDGPEAGLQRPWRVRESWSFERRRTWRGLWSAGCWNTWRGPWCTVLGYLETTRRSPMPALPSSAESQLANMRCATSLLKFVTGPLLQI